MARALRVEAGTLLAAYPDMLDPNFMHSVVLICQHDRQGAHGVVVNRRTDLTAAELFPEHPTLGGSSFPVHLGGPVEQNSLQFVHVVPARIPGGLSIDGRLWLGGDLDALGHYLSEQPDQALARVRLFLGYAGWSRGQLEGELSTGSWLPAPPSLEAVFGEGGEAVWRRVVRSLGDGGAGLQAQPPDVSWN